MTQYRDQGEGELVPGRGIEIVEVLRTRSEPTVIALKSGETILAIFEGYGRDIGEEWEHVYLFEDGAHHFLSTSDIGSLVDPESGAVLFSAS